MSGKESLILSHTGFNSATASNGQFPSSLAFSAFWTSFARGT